jgi:hypothetical protein
MTEVARPTKSEKEPDQMLERKSLRWERQQDAWVLYRSKAVLIEVASDQKYPGMWRVRDNSGDLSDMVNLTRAKDAAKSRALAGNNRSPAIALIVAAGRREMDARLRRIWRAA